MSKLNTNREFASLGHSIGLVRIALGLVLLAGGWKLAFPGDPESLVASYTAADGWIASFFQEWIQDHIGASVLVFLNTMGWIEMLVGLGLIVGFSTPWLAALAGLLFLSFAMANPEVGMIRISMDVSMAGFAFALAYTGSGRWSLDQKTGWSSVELPYRKEWFLGTVRVSLLYAFVLAVLFPFGIGTNPLNDTLPWIIVLGLTIVFLSPWTARWAAGVVAVWMLVLILVSVATELQNQGAPGLYWGVDMAKRQIGFFGACLAYFLTGPDRLALCPPGKNTPVREP